MASRMCGVRTVADVMESAMLCALKVSTPRTRDASILYISQTDRQGERVRYIHTDRQGERMRYINTDRQGERMRYINTDRQGERVRYVQTDRERG